MSRFKVGDIVKDSYWVKPYYLLILSVRTNPKNREVEYYYAYSFDGFLENYIIEKDDPTSKLIEIFELFKD